MGSNVQIFLHLQPIIRSQQFWKFPFGHINQVTVNSETSQLTQRNGLEKQKIFHRIYPVLAKFDHIEHIFLITVSSGSTIVSWNAGLKNM